MGVWQGVAMESLKFFILLRPAGGPPLKQPYGCFWGGPPAGQVACSRLLPLWPPHAVRLCLHPFLRISPKPIVKQVASFTPNHYPNLLKFRLRLVSFDAPLSSITC
jgi:hypothetical protein